MDIKSVLIVGKVGKQCLEILATHGISVVHKPSITETELMTEIRYYDALIVQSQTRVTVDVLWAGKSLKVVASAGAYFKNIDLFAAANRKIYVINAPRGCILSACEYTCTLIMALAKHLVSATCSYRVGIRERQMYTGSELKGSTLALVGLNEVAQGVAIRMKAFGMRVIGYDETYTAGECREFGVIQMTTDEMWPQADYIAIYTSPFDTKITTHITEDVLRTCKKGVRIVVMGHVNVFQPRDLYEGLMSGQVAAAAFDLYAEHIDIDFIKYCIFQHPSVICTTLLGTRTEEAIERGGQEAAEQIVNLVKPNTYDTQISKVIDFDEARSLTNTRPRFLQL